MNIEEVIIKKLKELVKKQTENFENDKAFYILQGQINLLFEILSESKRKENN